MTRKEKIEFEKKRQARLEAQEAYNANRKWETFDDHAKVDPYKVLEGRRNVGDFKSIKAQTGVTDTERDTQKYKSGDEFKETKDTSDSMTNKEKRQANRRLMKEYRKNTRAEKLSSKKGMSNQQAKDFMQNRRDRFRQMSTNFVKGLAGLPMDTKVDKRLMRRDGSGVLQNQIGKDGKVFDATNPFKGSVEKGFSDSGGSRDEVDTYLDLLRDNKATEKVEDKIIPEEKPPVINEVIEEKKDDTENRMNNNTNTGNNLKISPGGPTITGRQGQEGQLDQDHELADIGIETDRWGVLSKSNSEKNIGSQRTINNILANYIKNMGNTQKGDGNGLYDFPGNRNGTNPNFIPLTPNKSNKSEK